MNSQQGLLTFLTCTVLFFGAWAVLVTLYGSKAVETVAPTLAMMGLLVLLTVLAGFGFVALWDSLGDKQS